MYTATPGAQKPRLASDLLLEGKLLRLIDDDSKMKFIAAAQLIHRTAATVSDHVCSTSTI